jgi:hypothetical protein
MIANAPCSGPVKFILDTVDAAYHPIEIIPIPDNTVFLLEVQALGICEGVGADRAGYNRRAVIYRESGGPAIIEGPVNTDLTRESDTTWDVTILVTGVNVEIMVKGALGQTVSWKVSYTFEEVS